MSSFKTTSPSLFTLILFHLHLTIALLMTPSPKLNLRIELFFKDTDELRNRIQFLSSKGITSFNLVNKNNQDNLKHWINVVREEVPDCDVCTHYSLKYNKSRKKDGAFVVFSDFVENISNSRSVGGSSSSPASGQNEILLISGSGQFGKLDSVTALQKLQQLRTDRSSISTDGNENNNSSVSSTRIAVAYNPFFPSNQELELEQERFLKKITTKQVTKVYLQFGTDLERLKSSLDFLSKLREEHEYLSICGSIFLPTKKLIAQQKFRPWNGVFLCNEFLESENRARDVVLQMMKLYDRYGCEILIEAPGVRNEKDMDFVENLLSARDEIKNDSVEQVESKLFSPNIKTLYPVEKTSGVAKKRKIDKLSLTPSPLVPKQLLKKTAILLFGSHDVRLHDNIALQLASFHSSVIPVFIWSRKEQGRWGVRGAAEVVLKDALRQLDAKLKENDMRLICRSAEDASEELMKLCKEVCASAVYLNKEHTPESRIRERCLKEKFKVVTNMCVQVIDSQSSLLYDPISPSLSSGFHGGHWGTLMPFLKGCRKQLGDPRRPILRCQTSALIKSMNGPNYWPDSTPLDELDLNVIIGSEKWDLPITERFPMSEDDAVMNLNSFFSKGYTRYEKDRNRADIDSATSKLSVHLRIGTLSPNELYHKIEDSDLDYNDRKTFSRRLFWRDLAYFQLLNFPDMRDRSIRAHYEETEWVTGEEEKTRFNAWKNGQTGYPLVDAGMRELYKTGWMTQSVRMVVASFLTEYLRVNWVKGCEWFHYTLVDADSAINAMMWQNAGRSGIDQWNFVMSPEAASQDVTGLYTKKWVPSLSKLPKPFLQKPWVASTEILQEAGVVLGKSYPHRVIINLKEERQKSVDSVLAMRRKNQHRNDNRGYDLVTLPDGKDTVVFTKKEFRIDRAGKVLKAFAEKKTSCRSAPGRGRRGRVSKASGGKQI